MSRRATAGRRMNGVSLAALAARDTAILRQCVITETLVYDFIVKFTTLLSVYNYLRLLNIAVTSDPSSPSADHSVRPPNPLAFTYAPLTPTSVGSSYVQNTLPS